MDPEGSLYYDFHKTGEIAKARTYVVEGIGEDFFPSTMNMKILDDVLQVNDEECFVVARRLVKTGRAFHRRIGGGCISAALRLAKEPRTEEAFIVALLPDTGMRYLSKVYNDEWMRERGYVDSAVAITAAEVVQRQARSRQSPRTGHRPAVPNRFSRAQNHAGAGHLADSRCSKKILPIGTVYEDQILNLALQGKDLRKLVIREVMSKPLPQIPRTAPVERVTHILSHENPAVFVEMGERRSKSSPNTI